MSIAPTPPTPASVITGYRPLTAAEITIINTIKSMGISIDGMCRQVADDLKATEQGLANQADADAYKAATPERWVAIARTHFQEGLMALTRAVARPTTF